MASNNGNKSNGAKRPTNWHMQTAYVAAEPEMGYTPDGVPYASVRTYVPQGQDKDGNRRESLWLTMTAYGKNPEDTWPAQFAELEFLQKGNQVTFKGSQRYRTFAKKSGEKGFEITLYVDKPENVELFALAKEKAANGQPAEATAAPAEGEDFVFES